MKLFNYKKAVILLIILSAIFKCLLSQFLLLGNDEVYYISYAQKLQWNYFDHPPAVGLLIRLFTINLYFNHDLLIRAGTIISSSLANWFIYKTAETLYHPKAGFVAALLFNLNIYGSIISGLFIMPDAPLMLCWCLCLWIASSIAKAEKLGTKEQWLMLSFGIVAGLALLSKAQAIYLWFGMGLYILFFERSWLTKLSTYVSVCISFLIFLPALLWQFDHNNASIEFHKKRILFDGSLHVDYLLKEILGEFFYANPVFFILLIALILKSWNKNWSKGKTMVALLSIPLVLTVWGISIFRETLPHWSGPGILGLSVLMATPFLELNWKTQKKWILSASIFMGTILVGGSVLINFYPGTLAPNKLPNKYGHLDFTLDMYGWNELPRMLDSVLNSNAALKTNRNMLFLAGENWFPSAHLDHYVASPMHLNFISLGQLNDQHHYYWLNQYRPSLKKGDNMIFITTSSYFRSPDSTLSKQFEQSFAPIYMPQYRSGKLARYFVLYPYWGYKN